MGQKMNPVAMRLGVNKDWKSLWFASKADYSDRLKEDVKVRKFVQEKLKPAGVHSVTIKRFMNRVEIEIIVARPGVVIGRGGAGIEELKKEISRILQTNVDLKVRDVKKAELSAAIIAKNIAEGIEKRGVPKYLMRNELEKAIAAGAKGVKIWVSGRIKGGEHARTEKVQEGPIPLQTLRADIDYYNAVAETTNAGLLGVKVWIYKGEAKGMEEETDSESE